MKLVDVPEMGYTSAGAVQQGEICVRGPNVFKGYYKMPEKTYAFLWLHSQAFSAEEIDRDGWFHTGDVGQWLPNGSLRIIDRKKNIFKLAQGKLYLFLSSCCLGEYVAAEYLETVYLRSPYVASIFVYGDSLKNYLVAVVVPDFDVLTPAAAAIGVTGTPAELCQNEKVKNMVFDSLIKIGSEANVSLLKLPNVYCDSKSDTSVAERIRESEKRTFGSWTLVHWKWIAHTDHEVQESWGWKALSPSHRKNVFRSQTRQVLQVVEDFIYRNNTTKMEKIQNPEINTQYTFLINRFPSIGETQHTSYFFNSGFYLFYEGHEDSSSDEKPPTSPGEATMFFQ